MDLTDRYRLGFDVWDEKKAAPVMTDAAFLDFQGVFLIN